MSAGQTAPGSAESGMQTRAVNAAAAVLLASMERGRQTPTGLAIDLDSARLLNSPEHAAHVAELEAQRETLVARLKRGQEWQPGRNPALVSQDYLSQDELRAIFRIPLVAPWDDDEDPCRPCGCPKRFDRHAWGCPTLLAEDDGTGFFQPGHAYTHRPGPDSPGGPRLRFYCESVTTDKATGQPVARGWGGRRYGDRWTSVQRAHGLEDWQSGAWADTTTGGDA